MIGDNKILETLIRIKNRIETEVLHLRRLGEEDKIEYYDAKGIDKILREETNRAIKEYDKAKREQVDFSNPNF